MRKSIRGHGFKLASALLVALTIPPVARSAEPLSIDSRFAAFTSTTPGCAVGIERPGQPPEFKAYGQADLEHDVPITPDTVFEAGSVSKQFTAASILTLVADGKLALSDDVRRYIPELPDYGKPITIDALLNHTSGLRDWGGVEDIAGWPRSERVYSLNDVLAITVRQKALNYPPGTAWSYTNTGYNLLAIIVERVSGQPLPAFSKARLFTPLGMTHTSWRDDFRRVVKGRAIAYVPGKTGYEQLMPFENAIGNGGLLTTVGDLLIWNRALTEGKLGPLVTEAIQHPAVLTDGRPLNYARGLFVERYHGVREVSHAGATGGYRAWLGRYPDAGVSIALLCNAGEARSDRIGHALADLALAAEPVSAKPPSATTGGSRWSGWWVSDRDGAPLHLVAVGDTVRSEDGRTLVPAGDDGFTLGADVFTRRPDGKIQHAETGDLETFSPAPAFAPTTEALQAVVGVYASAEAAARFHISLKDGALLLTVEDRPDSTTPLKPAYQDAFTYGSGMVRLVRGPAGRVVALRLSDGRVWDLKAPRVE